MPKKVIKKSVVPKEVTVSVVPTKEKVSQRIYSNFVQVNHSPHDFTLTFCDILPVTENNKQELIKTQKLDAPIQAEIVISHSLVEPLMKALAESYAKFKSNIGAVETIKESKNK
jgi:hypothetical protein